MGDTSGHLERLLVSQLAANRDDNQTVDPAKAAAEAKELFDVCHVISIKWKIWQITINTPLMVFTLLEVEKMAIIIMPQ